LAAVHCSTENGLQKNDLSGRLETAKERKELYEVTKVKAKANAINI
jgi:hypothetical protein